MRPQTISNINGLTVDIEYLLSCQRTPCDPTTSPNPEAIFFIAGTSAANEYGVTPTAGRVSAETPMPEGQALTRLVQTSTDEGYFYGGTITGVTHTYIGYTPEDPGPPIVPAQWVPALWQVTDALGQVLAQGTSTYNPNTLTLTLVTVAGNGPRWQVNTVATIEVFPQP